MEHKEIKILVHKYFKGDSSLSEEEKLWNYFRTNDVAEELMEYKSFFSGLDELSGQRASKSFEDEMMDVILKEEHKEKIHIRWLWRTGLSIAASVIIILGGFILLRPQSTFQDSFDDPEIAYAYAENTVEYMAREYKKGIIPLSKFNKLSTASSSFNESIHKINDGFSRINALNKYRLTIKQN